MEITNERIVNCANALARYYYAIDIEAVKAVGREQLLGLESFIRSLNLDDFNQDGLSVTPGDREFHFLSLKKWLKEQHNCPSCQAERLTISLKGDFYCKKCFYTDDDDMEIS